MEKENKCKQMLSTCKAFCCRAAAFSVPKGNLSSYYRKFLQIHNIVIKSYENADIIIVPSRCKYLDENLNCIVYGKSKRPKRCKDASIISRNVFHIPGCRFTTKEQPYVLTKKDLENLSVKALKISDSSI